MPNITITKLTPNDIASLQSIGKQTFYETFAAGNTEEDMQMYLNESFRTDKLTMELQEPNSEFYFALLNNEPIGYLKLNFGEAQTELKDETAIEIERIYVLKEFHGKQVGQLLCDQALEVAKQASANYIWLGVWEKNLRAINFYTKNGFEKFDKHLFKLGKDEQTDIMMKLKL